MFWISISHAFFFKKRYADADSTQRAYEGLQKITLKGRSIKLGLAKNEANKVVPALHRNLTLVNKDGTSTVNSYNPYRQRNELSDTSLDRLDDDKGGVALNNRSRVLLMAKLQRGDEFGKASSDILKQVAPQASNPLDISISQMQKGTVAENAPVNTPCIVLKNVFDPKE